MKDDLMKLTSNQVSPYNAKASDWSAKTPAEGMESGKDKLMPEMEGPRHTEDDGPGMGYGTPVPVDRSRVIAAHFKVGQSKSEEGTSVKCNWGVDFEDGNVTPNVETE